MPTTPDPLHRRLLTRIGVLGLMERYGSPSLTRTGVQLAGVLLSLGLLAWVLSLVLAPANRDAISRMLEAGAGPPLALVGLTLVSLVVNGLGFRETLAPVQRIPQMEMQAVNAIATAASPLPFKMSLITRVAIHRRRHAVPFVVIGGWFVAFGVVAGCINGPALLASVARGRLDALWWLIFIAGVFACACGVLFGASLARRWERLDHLSLRAGRMLGDPRRLALLMGLRTADLATFVARFSVAATAMGMHLSFADAIFASAIYLMAGMVAPAGTLGVREGAVAGVAMLPGDLDPTALATLSLTVTVAEIATSLFAGAVGATWLKPHELLRRSVANDVQSDSASSAPGA
jgi:hypothetical protein